MIFNYILNSIEKFNDITNLKIYKIIYYIIAISGFMASYIFQVLYDVKCNIFGEIIRIIHHFGIFFVYFGFMAPINILWILFLLLCMTIISWILLNNKCIISVIENYVCNQPINRVFRDITYYTSRKLDNYLVTIRIPLMISILCFIILRLYVYYFYNKNENETNKISE